MNLSHTSNAPTATARSNDPVHSQRRDYDSYFPYASSMTEAPMFHLFASKVFGSGNGYMRSIITFLYKIRWILSYPLRTKIVPHCVPFQYPLIQITIGEVLLCAPVIYFLIEGFYAAFVSSTIASIQVTGHMTSYGILLTYLSANKSNSFFAFLFGIPFERMISFHYLCGVSTVILSIFHVYTCYEQRGATASTKFTSFLTQDSYNTSGAIATASIIALVTLSFHSKILRHYAFQLWLSSHIILAITVLVALFLHGVDIIVWFVAAWWFLDLVVRYGIMTMCQYRIPTNNAQLRRVAHVKDDPMKHTNETTIEISFIKPPGFMYSPGQFVQIAIPSISIFEFHPVSISSAPHEEYVTMHLRDRGDWTHKLVQLTDSKTSTAIWMEGPYGSLSVDMHDAHRYQMVLLLCAGIGVTPIQSIGKSILYEHQHQNRPLKHMHMVWVVRDMNIVHDLPPLSLSSKDEASTIDSNVQIDIYCTRSNENSNVEPADAMVEQPHSDPEVGQETVDVPNNDGDCSYYNVLHGQRPDINAIFQQMKKCANEMSETNIAVFACGPPSFMMDVQIACHTYSQPSISFSKESGVYFDLHTEHFEY